MMLRATRRSGIRWTPARRPVRLVLAAAMVSVLSSPALSEESKRWVPPVPDDMPVVWDWIQLTSLEWLKGEFVALYDDELEFDSDELDTLTLDWDDVKRVRTARRMEVRLRGNVELYGRLFVEDDLVRIIPVDGPTMERRRGQLVSITSGSPKELDHWGMKISLGTNVRRGNTEIFEANLSSKFVRRSARRRITLDYLGNYNVTEDELVTNNHRASATWYGFVSDRFFWIPVFGEYFRDPFQNIAHRATSGIGFGYEIIDRKKTEWRISAGPAYQKITFDNVLPDQEKRVDTPAVVFASAADVELTGWMDFIAEYKLQITDDESGSANHHLEVAFETEITSLLDFDVRWVWDRIRKPQQDADGNTPGKDDVRLIVALGFDF